MIKIKSIEDVAHCYGLIFRSILAQPFSRDDEKKLIEGMKIVIKLGLSKREDLLGSARELSKNHENLFKSMEGLYKTAQELMQLPDKAKEIK